MKLISAFENQTDVDTGFFGKHPSQNDVFISVVRGLHISFCISLTSFTSSELRLNAKTREEIFLACSQYEIEKK